MFGRLSWKMWLSVWLNSIGYQRMVVKSIRSNLLLGWLSRYFEQRVIFLMRHPAATIYSQYGRKWKPYLKPLLQSAPLMRDYLSKHEGFLNSIVSASDSENAELKRFAALWAIDNLVPLKQIQAGSEILLVTYEELVRDPLGTLTWLFNEIGWELDEVSLQISQQQIGIGYSGLKNVFSPDELLSRWKRQMSKAEIDTILTITHRLGVELYDDSLMPRREGPWQGEKRR
jgi:hypothetical protein